MKSLQMVTAAKKLKDTCSLEEKVWPTSVHFSCSVMSNSLWLYGLQHTRLPSPSPTPGAWSNSCPLSQWCHPTISSSVSPSPPTFNLSQHQFSSAQSYLTLCDPMNCSMPGLPVHHQLPEFTQTNVHWVGDAIQPSHPLSSPSPPAFNLS